MANAIEVQITGSEDVSQTVETVADSSRDAAVRVTNAMGSTEEAFDTAARSSGRFGSALDTASGAASQLGGAVEGFGGSVQAIIDLQNAAANRAAALARAENDVEQAMVDGKQAAIDLEQATIDLNQSRVDGKQYALDAKQAQADQTQAMIDAQQATVDYATAVKEEGEGSIAAQQAKADLTQANLDLEQANIDLEQSTVDATQANADAKQAALDMEQANVDAGASALDLADAQTEVATQSSGWQQVATQAGLIAPVIMGVVAAVDLLALANTALHASFIKTAASAIAARVAIIASSIATGIATAAQWLWNVAMMANPIGLIIAGILLIVGVIIYLATQTTFFQDLWTKVWTFLEKPVKWLVDMVVGYAQFMWNMWSTILGAVKDFFVWAFKSAIDFIVGYFNFIWSLPGKVWNVFKAIGDAIWQPLKWAFNMVSWAWNNTVGRLSFRIPDWVPGLGGNGFSMPRLPQLATGGDVTRTGMALIHKGERVVPAGTRGLGASGQGGEITIVIDMSSVPAEIRTWIRKMTRVYGGSGDNNVKIAWG
jgi:hypothetical protein